MNTFPSAKTDLPEEILNLLPKIDFDQKVIEAWESPTGTQKTFRYDLEIPEDIHWHLVRLAADLKMHQEDYVEWLLSKHIEHQLDQQVNHSVPRGA